MHYEETNTKKKYSPEQAWSKALKWCAYQERSQQDVRDKLYDYGLHEREVEELISRLIQEGFLNEERFAIAFAGGKFRILGWGKVKIKLALKQKRVSDYCIKKALSQIDDKAYIEKLKRVVLKRSKEIKEKDTFKRNYKLAQYALSRGFEQDIVWSIVGELVS
jgi:regulatory protein